MDAFSLAISYGILNVKFKYAIITATTVGIFHFFMPLLGNLFGTFLFEHTIFNLQYILFLVFLILSISMFIDFFSKKEKIPKLNIISVILFAISVSIDSFSIGIGIRYLYSNIYVVTSIFLIISFIFTLIGFYIGKIISKDLGKYALLLGALLLFFYSFYIIIK